MAELHGWQMDPFGVHEQRYFSQGQPTKLVRDRGIESYDPPPVTDASPTHPAFTVATAPPAVGAPTAATAHGDHSAPEERLGAGAPIGAAPPSPAWAASNGRGGTHEEAVPSARFLGGPEPSGPAPGWWLASDGNWYPPELADTGEPVHSAPDVASSPPPIPPPRPGWWLASDGNWYPPDPVPAHQSAPPPAGPALSYPTAHPLPAAPDSPSTDARWTTTSDPQPAAGIEPGGPASDDRALWMEPTGPAPSTAPPATWPSVAGPETEPVGFAPGASMAGGVPPAPGWWLASDGNWYPPELAHPAEPSNEPSYGVSENWHVASSGGGHVGADPVVSEYEPPHEAPESTMFAEVTPGPNWWLASDGNWYPPELADPAAAGYDVVTYVAPEPGTQEHGGSELPAVGYEESSAPPRDSPPAEPPPRPGWWLASDGNWYPPELAEPDEHPAV